MNRAFCRSRNLNTVLPIGLPGYVAGHGIALDDGRLVAIPVSFVIFEMCLAGNYAGCLINDLLYPYP